MVLAPCVILENEEGSRREAYQGAVVEVQPKQVDHLLALGFVAKVGTPEAVIPVAEDVGDPDVAATSDDPPKKTAPKADWVDYAVADGYDRDEIEAMSKADIVALFD